MNLRIVSLGLLSLLVLPEESSALLSRHNEQGLSSSHSYKRSGVEGVVSNLNGNLVLASTPVNLPGVPLGVNLTRTWNSHWRDPLFSFQYDMDHNAIVSNDPKQQKPSYRDVSVKGNTLDIGGFATRRVQKFGTPAELPLTWAFAQSVSMNLIEQAASEAITQAINKAYASDIADLSARVQESRNLGVEFMMSGPDSLLLHRLSSDNLAAQQALGAAIYLLSDQSRKDFKAIADCGDKPTNCGSAMLSLTANMGGAYINSGLTNALGTSNVPFLGIADVTYNLASGKATPEDAAWQVGTMIGQNIAAQIVGGGAAGGVAGIAVAAAVQLLRLYIVSLAEWNKTFDVGGVNVDPWVLGVNGYVGMTGINLDPELQKGQKRFQRKWSARVITKTCDNGEEWPACQVDEDGHTIVTYDTAYDQFSESRHPMPDLQLVGSDGGAARFILSDDSARTVDGRRWVSYVSLSNTDQRKIYYCLPRSGPDIIDLGIDPSESAIQASRGLDTSGFYLVKEPDGSQVVLGTGREDKGLVPDHQGYHTYWAVPSKFRNPSGDSVIVVRDSSHHVVSVRDSRTGRGARVSEGMIVSAVLAADGSVVRAIDTTWYSVGDHSYNLYSGANGAVDASTPVLNWEAKRIGANQIDTTVYSYSNGDLVTIDHANGSRTRYSYSGTRNTTLDGFVRTVVDYPDRDQPNFFLERDYTYDGWVANRPQSLRTSVHTMLQQPDHVANPATPWRQSETTDWYIFAPLLEARNINMSLHGYKGMTTVQRTDGWLHDTDKVLDSLQFKTSRFHLMAEYHGAGSPSMKRTQYAYNGDRKILQMDSRGLSANYDPKITVWEYDDEGNVLRERVCPSDLADLIASNPTLQSTGFVMRPTCPEVDTRYGVQNRKNGEFWNITNDSTTVRDSSGSYRVVTQNNHPNPRFRVDSLYRLGIATSRRFWRTGGVASGSTTFNLHDSTLIADSTEYQDWRGSSSATPLIRPVRMRTWTGGAWQVSLDIAYADAQNRPALPSSTSRYLTPSSVAVEETSYDSVFQLLPSRTRLYTAPQTPGASPSGSTLDTTRFFDVDRGWVLAKKDPGGHSTTMEYDRSGRPTRVVQPDGGVTSYTYVDRLQPISSWRRVAGFSSNYPDQKTVAVRQTDPSGVTTEARFDGLGRLVAHKRIAKGADPATLDTSMQTTTLVSYNIFDKLQWKRDADGREEFHDFDGTGRETARHVFLEPTLASSRSLEWKSSYTYNDSARTLIEQDPLGTKTVFHWDGLGRDTLIERDADSGAFYLRLAGDAGAGVPAPQAHTRLKVHQIYDNAGNLVKLVDPKGLVETRRYDERNRLLWTNHPDDLRHSTSYDLGARPVSDTIRMASRTSDSLTVRTLVYDATNRLLNESFGAGARENLTYSWDSYGASSDPGRLLALTRGTGLVASYGYDAMGRRTSRQLSLPSLYAVNQGWAYDVAGGLVRQDLPGAAREVPSYDAYHRLRGISLVHGADSIPTLHDLRSTRADLLAGYNQGARLTETNIFEAQRPLLLQSLVQKTNPSRIDTLYLQRMAWDGAGNVAGMRRNLGDTLGFDVDHQYQLREIHYPDGQSQSYGYDWNGNRTRLTHPMGRGMSDTFSYTANRVTTGTSARKGWTVYRHDSRGNLGTQMSFASAADTTDPAKAWRLVDRRWNKSNELERVRIINRLPFPDTTWLRFDYGEDGNRILSAVARGGDTSSWTVTHKWVYDGSIIVADSGSDHGWNWHVYNGLNRVAEATDSSGKTRVRYVLTDHQGTTQALLDDTGAVLGRWIWDPWGNIEESWTQRTTELLYQGKPYEPTMGEWYFNSRWYSPERGSFTGRDPKLQFWTPYSYVGNQSLTGLDPDGQSTILDGSGIVSSVSNNGNTDIVLQADLGNSCSESVIGKTQYWDEFHRGAKVNQGVDISRYVSYLIDSYSNADAASKSSSLKFGFAISAGVLANASRSRAVFDIKKNLNPDQGYLLNGYYVSGESAGNYLFGRNVNVLGMSWTPSMWLAGAYHVWSNKRFGSESYAPYYGETEYAGRQIRAGYFREY